MAGAEDVAHIDELKHFGFQGCVPHSCIPFLVEFNALRRIFETPGASPARAGR